MTTHPNRGIDCNKCKESKPREEFYVLYAGHPGAQLRQPCKECIRSGKRRRYANSAGRGADRSYEQLLKRDYGMTLDQYNQRVRQQVGRCAICRRAETAKSSGGKVKRLSVDHDHVTGAVRGLLCHRCNIVVWALEDNHVTIGAVSEYIEQWRTTFANGAPL